MAFIMLCSVIIYISVSFKKIKENKGTYNLKWSPAFSAHSSKTNSSNKSNSKWDYKTVAENKSDLQALLVRDYYSLANSVLYTTSFYISPQDIIDILDNKRIFVFQNNLLCKVYTSTTGNNIFQIEIDFTYTQGYKIFRAILCNDNFDKLSQIEKITYERILDIYHKITLPSMTDLQT
jgi:hypothetical protein